MRAPEERTVSRWAHRWVKRRYPDWVRAVREQNRIEDLRPHFEHPWWCPWCLSLRVDRMVVRALDWSWDRIEPALYAGWRALSRPR